MADDDDADCVEHVWEFTGMTLTRAGTHKDWSCTRCTAVMVQGPDEIAGRV